MSYLDKVPFEVTIVSNQEEQIYAEREIICRHNDQDKNEETEKIIWRISGKIEDSPVDHKNNHNKEKDNEHNMEISKREKHEQNKNDETNCKKFDEHRQGKEQNKFKGRPRNNQLDPNGPKDKYNIVRIMFFILGIIHALPLTFISAANEYWMYKLRNTTSNSTDANDRTYLQANFVSLSYLITVGPNTIAQFLLTFYGHKINAKSRIMFTLTLHSLVFLLQTAFVEINTDDCQLLFFWIAMVTITLVNCSINFGGTGNMVTLALFPDQYMKSFLVGEGIASLITAVMRLISIIVSPSTTGAALIYFVTGSCMMTFSTLFFYLCTHTEFFRYYTRNINKSTKKRVPNLKEFKEVLGYIWPLLVIYIIALFIPQAQLANLVVSEYYGTDSIWGTKYFVTCTTYLLPAIGGLIARMVFFRYEINPSMTVLFILTLGREIVYTPLLYFVNAKPRHHLPVLFPHDWQYALIIGTQSLASGYLSSMATLKSLRIVPEEILELSWLVTLFIVKIAGIAASPMALLSVKLL